MAPTDESTPRGTAPQPAGDFEPDNEGASQSVPPPLPRRPRVLQNATLILLVLIALIALAAYFHVHK